jgi:hypothetical protein
MAKILKKLNIHGNYVIFGGNYSGCAGKTGKILGNEKWERKGSHLPHLLQVAYPGLPR